MNSGGTAVEEVGEDEAGEGSARGFEAFFWSLLGLHLAVVLWVPQVPTQDGPVHLASSAALGELLFGDPSPIVDRYYEIHPVASTTWGLHAVLALLHQLLSPAWVERLTLLVYVLALPLSARSLLRATGAGEAWRALVFFPLLLNFHFHTGLWSYCLSLPLLLWLLALWIRNDEQQRRGTGWLAGSVAVASLLVVAHPVTWVVGALALSCLVAQEAWSRARPGATAGTFLRRRLGPLAATLAPGAVLVLGFAASQAEDPVSRWPWAVVWRSLLTLNSLVSFDRREIAFTVAWGVLLGIGVVWARLLRRRAGGGRGHGLLWAAALVLVLYFASPDSVSGGSLVTPRLGLSFWLLLTVWLVIQRWTKALRGMMLAGAVGVSFGLLSLHAASYLRLGVAYDQARAVEPYLEPQRTLLPLVFAARGTGDDGEALSIKVRPLVSIGSRLAVERGLVDLNNYQAETRYFPLVFRPGLDPSRWLWRTDEAGRRHLDLAGYHRDTAGRVDYVLLWGLRPGARYAGRNLDRLGPDLAASYDLTYRSPDGRILLFSRRDAFERDRTPRDATP